MTIFSQFSNLFMNVFKKRRKTIIAKKPTSITKAIKKRVSLIDISQKQFSKLTDAQITLRERAIEVLHRLRQGKNFDESINVVEITETNLKKHLGKAIYKKLGKWAARKYDSIQRQMLFYENGEVTTIVVQNSRDATKVARYMNAVKKALKDKDSSELQKFRRRSISDATGRKRKFETSVEKLYEIDDRKEEPELYEVVYKWH